MKATPTAQELLLNHMKALFVHYYSNIGHYTEHTIYYEKLLFLQVLLTM
jgi:hypothetical protein